LYNVDPDALELFRRRHADGEGYYPAVDENDGTVAAFAVYGAEARVSGQAPVRGTLDVGIGVRPDLTSQGLGSALIDQVTAVAQRLFGPRILRTAVATFNERSLALCRKAGFQPVRNFAGPGGRSFRELVVTLPAPPAKT
jgi:ribosomal-protein-alanine N-acetyltransferase